MNRRELVALAAVLGGGATVGGVWAATRGDKEASSSTPAAATPPPSTPVVSGTPAATPPPAAAIQMAGERALVETRVADLSGFVARREVTVAAVVEAAEARIRRHDRRYGAVIEVNPDAAAIAAELDAETAAGTPRGPFHGIPVLLKDIVATGDRMRTSAGSLALAENDVIADATIVRRLREAGAVILGKANMTEWSNVRSVGQVPGWSDRGGQTRNPYDADLATWGSSSGSAAAVALSYAPIAIGVETNGSILCPAAACGVVGLKPTVGLVSRFGVLPLTWSFDSPGPMGRTVADVAAAMNVIAGYDPGDPAYGVFGWASPAATVGGAPVHAYGEVDYTRALDRDALRGARLGIAWAQWGNDPAADEVVMDAIQALERAGAEIVEPVDVPLIPDELLLEVPAVMDAEFLAGTTAFFRRFMPDGPLHSLADVIEWNLEHAEEALAWMDQEGLAETLEAMPLDDPRYSDLLWAMVTSARDEGLDAALDTYELDALIAPAAPLPTPIDEGAPFPGSGSKLSSLSGYPAITVPAGAVDGMPVGLQLNGRAFSEERLIGLGYAIERVLDARVPPEI